MKNQSKFTYREFNDGFDDYAVSQQRFTRETAIDLYMNSCPTHKSIKEISIGQAWVKWRYGWDPSQNKHVAGWWIEYSPSPRACPVWVFHVTGTRDSRFETGYTVIKVNQ